MDFSYNNKFLKSGDKTVEFTHEIRDAQMHDEIIYVLLSIPFNENVTDNLYAFNLDLELKWQSQKLREVYPHMMIFAYEYMTLTDECIITNDFYARRQFIDYSNGKIIRMDVTK